MARTVSVPDVSVCVTAFRHAPYLRQCVESVLAQEFGGTLEVIVGDDASDDGSAELLAQLAREHGPRVVPLLHGRNVGPGANLKALVARARAPFVAHLDGDDYWLPGKLAAQLACLERDAGVVAVYGNAIVIDEAGRRLGVFNGPMPSVVSLESLLRRGNFLNHSSLLYRREAWQRAGFDRTTALDFLLHVRFARLGRLAYVDAPLVAYRWRTPGSMVMRRAPELQRGQLEAFLDAIAHGAPAAWAREGLSRYWGKLLVASLLHGQPAAVRQGWRQLRGEPAFGFSRGALLGASALAFLRAARAWWRRRVARGERVFAPGA